VVEQDEVVKIRVGDFTVGIVGLKAALEETIQKNFSSDPAVAQYLLEHLKSKNYIPPSAEHEYGSAFLREYKRYRGEPVGIEQPHELQVKVLGPGCPNCDKLEQMVYKVMAADSIVGSVEHVRDLNEIAAYGMVATPALVINGEVKCGGRLPKESQLRAWLEEAAEKNH
jgi:small redox-active disulfide protein 2